MDDGTYKNVCLELANLFFLDTEHSENFHKLAANHLKETSLSVTELRQILEKQVAPVAGVNLGYLIFPVIGEWSGFDKEDLAQKIKYYSNKRNKRPQWLYCIQDFFVRRMIKDLETEKFFQKYF